MRTMLLCTAIAMAAPAVAQQSAHPDRTIQVTGSGKVATPPNLGEIEYSLAGEGRTPDEASRALVTIRRAIADQVTSLLGGNAALTDSDLVILAARGPRCTDADGYDAKPRLSEGDCAVTGYLATARGHIRTSEISRAGTAVGLASSLGARDARLQKFGLADDRAAQRAATAEAVADARRQAEDIATAAGQRLGRILSIRNQGSRTDEIVVTGQRSRATPSTPITPVEIDLSPPPIETTAQVNVTFELLP